MITAILGDITKQRVDAIVNAANTNLLAGGGVCGAIHAVAGPELQRECVQLGGCPTGEARITSGYKLPARLVIHAVGPKYWDGTRNEASLLRSCYQAIFRIAKENQISSVAIPAISTGIYRFPIAQATAIAVDEAKKAIRTIDIAIIFCCFDKAILDVYTATMNHADINLNFR